MKGGKNSCAQIKIILFVYPHPRECDSFGRFMAIDINCINTPVDNNAGSIIPFSSGITEFFISIASGTTRVASLIGFGTAITGVTILSDNTIDLTGLLSEAFSVPRNGNITAISATLNYFLDP